MNTSDTEKLYQEKELAYQMKATGNRSQTDHTPDTEWEWVCEDKWHQTWHHKEHGDRQINTELLNFILASRDTYWKEMVRKEVEGMKKKPICKNPACGKESHPCQNTIKNQALDTLLDNLK